MTTTRSSVRSQDGARIAPDRLGDGPPVILLGGAADRRGPAVADFMRSRRKGVAHTLPYDGAVMGETVTGRPLAVEPRGSVPVPTVVGHSHDVSMRVLEDFFAVGAAAAR